MSKKIAWYTIVFECLVIPFLIFLFSFDPYYTHGFIVPQDEGQHLAWINSISHGRVIYRDIYMFYGPLLEYIPLVLMKIFGFSVSVLRAFYHFGSIVGLILAYFFARIVLKEKFFLYVAAFLLVTTRIASFWSARWGGPRLAVGIAALLLLMLYRRFERPIFLCLAGFVSGITFLVSQEIGLCTFFSSLVFVFAFSLLGGKFPWRKFFSRIGYFAMGALFAIIPFLVYLILNKALKDYIRISFYDVPFLYPRVFVDKHSFVALFKIGLPRFLKDFRLVRIPLIFISMFIYMVATGVFLRKIFLRKFGKDDTPALTLLAFGGPLFLFATRQLEGMQFNMAAPPIVILGCLMAEKLFSGARDSFKKDVRVLFSPSRRFVGVGRNSPCPCGSGKKYKHCCMKEKRFTQSAGQLMPEKRLTQLVKSTIAIIVLVFSLYFMVVGIDFKKLVFYTTHNITNYGRITKIGLMHGGDPYITAEEGDAWRTGWSPLELERAKGIYVPEKKAKVLTKVFDYLDKRLKPGEQILVFPHEGQYYFLLNRLGPTKFDSLIYASITDEYQKDVIKILEESKVRYIIYVRDSYVFTNFKKIPNEERLHLIVDYINGKYVEEAQFDETYILRRKG